MTNWESVVADVERFEKNKADHIVPTGSIMLSKSSGVLTGSSNELHSIFGYLNDWSATQFFSLLGMPGNYFKKLYFNKDYHLIDQHVNHNLLKLDPRKPLFIRTREFEENGGLVRGILSDRYSVFDNIHLVEILDQIFGNTDQEYDINSHVINDLSFHLRITFPALDVDMGETTTGENDIIRTGVHITNSEVGRRSVTIEPLVFRLICSNGLMGWSSTGAGFRQRHMWLKQQEMYNRVAEALVESLQAGSTAINLLSESRNVKVDDPLAIIEDLAKENNITKKDTELIKTSFAEEPEHTIYGVVNSFTRAARTMEADKRFDMEILSGKILAKEIA